MLTYREKVERLRAQKVEMTKQKVKAFAHRPGFLDTDDKGWVLPPEDWKFEMEYEHPDGVFGPGAWARNFYRFLNSHPA
ncbi:MAG: hypothetical protein LBB50_07005, partial [Oscillospiraceae bacterium]|nr:hypothetical protein [Oscillospiraceae bacterium]